MSRCLAERRTVVGHEFLNTLPGHLMLNVEVLPRLFQICFLIQNGCAYWLVCKTVIREWATLAGPFLQHLRRNGYEINSELKTIQQMLEVSDTGSQDEQVPVTPRQHALGPHSETDTEQDRQNRGSACQDQHCLGN